MIVALRGPHAQGQCLELCRQRPGTRQVRMCPLAAVTCHEQCLRIAHGSGNPFT
jgi:hypothetical protein